MANPFSYDFANSVKIRLINLRDVVQQDLAATDTEAQLLHLTFRQADDLVHGLDSAIDAYKAAVKPLYGSTKRGGRARSSGGTSYFLRRKEIEGQITRLADEAIAGQGHVSAEQLLSGGQYRKSSVYRVLDQLAEDKGWEKRKERGGSFRYVPKAPASKPEG